MSALIQEIKKIKSTTKELREFGFVVGGVILALSGVSYWRHGSVVWAWPIAGGVLVFLGAVFPAVLKPLQKVWMALALVMGAVMSRVIIALIFFLVVTPLALVLKAQGKRLLERGTVPGAASYWNLRGADSADPKRCERQY